MLVSNGLSSAAGDRLQMLRLAAMQLTWFGFQVLFDPPKSLRQGTRQHPLEKVVVDARPQGTNGTAESPHAVAMS